MRCNVCNSEIKEGALFCTVCDNKIQQVNNIPQGYNVNHS